MTDDAVIADEVRAWLLAGDPAIAWQVRRDLDGVPPPSWTALRAATAERGWGADLLARRDPEGTWGGGLYSPKWTSTTYTLLLLRDLGVPATMPPVRDGAQLLLDAGVGADGAIHLFADPAATDTCVTGMALAIGAAFTPDDERLDRLAANLLAEQMPDGGWNCERIRGGTHASFHTTISVLEGLAAYAVARGGGRDDVVAAAEAGRELLLAHRLFRSHRTGEVVDPRMTRLSFPPRWHYDVLRALDHLRAVGAPRDERAAEAVALVARRRRADGRWPLQQRWPGRTFFEMERPGAPSRWNTLRAARVLAWWGSGATSAEGRGGR